MLELEKVGYVHIIMEHLPPEGWGDLATKKELAEQGRLLRGEFALGMSELRRELTEKMSELRGELKDEIAGLRTELKRELADVRHGVSATVERLGKEMSQEFTKQQKWMFTTMGGMFGGTAAIISAVVLLVK